MTKTGLFRLWDPKVTPSNSIGLTWKGGQESDSIVVPFVAFHYRGIVDIGYKGNEFNESMIYAWTRQGAFNPMKKDQEVKLNRIKKVDSYESLDQFVKENSGFVVSNVIYVTMLSVVFSSGLVNLSF